MFLDWTTVLAAQPKKAASNLVRIKFAPVRTVTSPVTSNPTLRAFALSRANISVRRVLLAGTNILILIGLVIAFGYHFLTRAIARLFSSA